MRKRIVLSIAAVTILFWLTACSEETAAPQTPIASGALVTFVEIGSNHCVPCLQMRPIMDSLASEYGEAQLKVIFVDVFKDKAETERYRIRVMPTQVFLDKQGVEFHRHEGFYPKASIDSLLYEHGLRALDGG